MAKPKLSELKQASAWLGQFESSDRQMVTDWLDALRLVTVDELMTKLVRKIKMEADAVPPGRQIALYIEREVRRYKGGSQRAFFEKLRMNPKSGKTNMHAYGKVPKLKPIVPARSIAPEIGSEGIIANVLTQLQRENPTRFIINPGPDLIRSPRRIGVAFVVTDFIGSGKRTSEFLDAFWRHRTVKSWSSLRLFHLKVISFTATETGYEVVSNHRSRPGISWVAPCPTVDTEFSERDAARLKALFAKYDPVDKNPIDSLGFGGQAAMMVFSHGCPNNVPRLLYKKGRRWAPLFYGRTNMLEEFSSPGCSGERLNRFSRLGHPAGATSLTAAGYHSFGSVRLLVLAAINVGHRFVESISIATGIDIDDVDAAVVDLQQMGWVTDKYRITDEGRRNLASGQPFQLKSGKITAALRTPMYYPKSLRPPVKN